MKRIMGITLALSLVAFLSGIGWAANIRMNIMYGPKHPLSTGIFAEWAENVNQVTQGRVKVTLFFNSALADVKQVMNATVSGVCDVGVSCPTYSRERFPLSSILDLPMVGTSSAEKSSEVFWKLYEKYPELQQEYADVKLLWVYMNPAYQLHFRNRKVEKLEDMKGVVLSGGGGMSLEMLKAYGANPEAIVMTEVFLALQKGVIEGCFLPYAPLRSQRIADITQTHTVGDFIANTFYVVMNKETWGKISAEDQKAIDQISGLAASKKTGSDFDKAEEKDVAWMKEKGDQFYVLAPEERQRWAESTAFISENWLKEVEARGLPGRAFMKDALEMLRGGAK
jgi:TRAP-type transport system periplasmic protein